MLTMSSRPPAIAPASSANIGMKPWRERSTASQATSTTRQNSAPPSVGVPSLAGVPRGTVGGDVLPRPTPHKRAEDRRIQAPPRHKGEYPDEDGLLHGS